MMIDEIMSNEDEIRVMPDDIIVEILLLLPAKTLARCKSVCKTWYKFTKIPNFITNYRISHSRFVAVKSPLLPLQKPSLLNKYETPFNLFLDESLSVIENITVNPIITNNLPFTNIHEILGPVNGLYCIRWFHSVCEKYSDYKEFIAFWNPSTTEFRQLKYPIFPGIPSPCRFGVIGFGSSTDDDIKLVCVTGYEYLDIYIIVLYSLAHDCWRQIETDTYLGSFKFGELIGSAYLNGAYYWLINNSYYQLFVFDMRTEVFRDTVLPNECQQKGAGILVRNNSIVYFVTRWSRDEYGNSVLLDCVDVFEMKEELGFWNKLFSFVHPFRFPTILGFWKDDEIIFQAFPNDKLMLHNIHTNQSRKLGIDGDFRILDYEESLT